MASNSPERKELDRVLNALALELPASVHADASRRIRDLFDAALDAERQQQQAASKARVQELLAVPVPPTIATDDEFRDIYCQGYRHALSDVVKILDAAVSGAREDSHG